MSAIHTELPELLKLEFRAQGFSFLPRQPVTSLLSGRHGSLLRGRGLNFEEIRRYLPGDDVRNIDWHVTARLQKPYIRVYTEERDRSSWLLVDQRSSMFFGTRRTTKANAAAETAALSAWKVLHSGDRVGAIIFNDEEIVEITPQRSRERVIEILSAIVRMNKKLSAETYAPNPEMIDEVIGRVRNLVFHDCLVALISDGFGIDEGTQRPATEIAEHNDLIGIFLYDPLEKEMPDIGTVLFGANKGRVEINTSSKVFSDNYREDFSHRLVLFEELCRKRAMPLIPLSTEFPIIDQFHEHLGKHLR